MLTRFRLYHLIFGYSFWASAFFALFPQGASMASFMLRKIDDALWSTFRQRAHEDGHTPRWVMLRLVESYIRHGLPPVAAKEQSK